jgi:hypothetical protein
VNQADVGPELVEEDEGDGGEFVYAGNEMGREFFWFFWKILIWSGVVMVSRWRSRF